jgi:hypothetical protein
MANKYMKVGKFGKWFPGNHFPENKHNQKEKYFSGNQTKIFFDWKVFFVDQLF